ncbi:unnamed protein product, partial [Phaeothamnion confervicola]
MKRVQLNSPMGSPYVTQTLRAKHKRTVDGAAAPSGTKPATTTRGAAKRAAPSGTRGATADDNGQAPASSRRHFEDRWSQEMDETLREAVLRYGPDWPMVADHLTCFGASPHDCQQRWVLVQDMAVKGPWAAEEDDLLRRLVDLHGSKKWSQIAQELPGRSGKQCRERWLNHLDTRVKKSLWSDEEDRVLCEAQYRLGNKWSEISKLLPGRAENAVKNRFNSIVTKRIAGGAHGGGG